MRRLRRAGAAEPHDRRQLPLRGDRARQAWTDGLGDTVEAIVHGWDLAKATGQPTEVDPDLYEVAWQNSKDIDDRFRGRADPSGPP